MNNLTHPTDQASAAASLPVFDVVGVGLGPFNLGMAALCQPLVEAGELTAAFFEARPEFIWHPGMLLPESTIQVPFLADLVTMADPTSRFSFLNYLKLHGRIHQFYIRESFYPLRREYSDYCAWVAKQLPTAHFSSRVTAVRPAPATAADGVRWLVDVSGHGTVGARNVLSGVGTTPFVPAELAGDPGAGTAPGVYHSAEYLPHRDELLRAQSVAIVGSGQSAAEIYADLLATSRERGARVDWFTRSERFFPMEYTKLTLEMTSPEYAEYFHDLPMELRDGLNRRQRNLYKGISGELINDIYDTLYRLSFDGPPPTSLRAGVAVSWAPTAEEPGAEEGRHRLALHHLDTDTHGVHSCDAVVLCTGYRAPRLPEFLQPAADRIRLDAAGRMAVGTDFAVDDNRSLFILNGEEHTHSLNAPDLGMGPWRNSVILARILGREVYPIEDGFTFQTFGGFHND